MRTKLYLSGGIAGRPDFRERFRNQAAILEEFGYIVANPLDVVACRAEGDDTVPFEAPCLQWGEPGTEGAPHSWACYLRYDLIEMLKCDGIAVMPDSETSKGSRLELFLAGQVGLHCGSVSSWCTQAAFDANYAEIEVRGS